MQIHQQIVLKFTAKDQKQLEFNQKYSNYPYKIKGGRVRFLIINDAMNENRRHKYISLSLNFFLSSKVVSDILSSPFGFKY